MYISIYCPLLVYKQKKNTMVFYLEVRDIKLHLEDAVLSEDSFFVIGRIPGKDGNDDHFVNINYYSILSNKITASDTSMTPNGTPKRDLSSVDSSMFDRLIIIQVKQMKEN